MRLRLVGKNQFMVSLPADLIRALRWQKGDKLLPGRDGEKLVLEKLGGRK